MSPAIRIILTSYYSYHPHQLLLVSSSPAITRIILTSYYSYHPHQLFEREEKAREALENLEDELEQCEVGLVRVHGTRVGGRVRSVRIWIGAASVHNSLID